MTLKLNEPTQFSQNWERFFILWMNTPEVFVGSCILSIVAVVVVFFITRSDSSIQDSRADRHSNESKNKSRITTRQFLNNPPDDQDDYHENSDSDTSGLEFPFGELSSYKKSLYRVAAEKLEKSLTEEQLSEEIEVRQQQLAAIYKLMKSKEEVFGIHNIDQMEEQLKFYG